MAKRRPTLEQRSINLPAPTWRKLDKEAKKLSFKEERYVSVSEIFRRLLEQRRKAAA